MKLTKTLEKNDVQKIQDDQSEDIGFSIDKEDEWVIFKSFTNYSDPIGSIVREITSNSFDAHIDAGIKKDVKVEITEENDLVGTSRTIGFRDYGNGMSPKIIRTIYSKFGKSTKRDRDDAIGAFGFGAKSPLSYQDAFDLITYHNWIKYHYSVHKGEKKPIITPMNKVGYNFSKAPLSAKEKPKDLEGYEVVKERGTEVIINIKKGDTRKFKDALKRQLKYFENIRYVNCGISNDYTIIRGEHFIYRLDKNSKRYNDNEDLHLCLGKVTYPIDRQQIGRWNINVGLYFDIGDIPVVWNRENVEYTDKAIKKIKEKVKLARKELQQLYDKQYKDIDSIEKLFEFSDLKNLVPLLQEEEEGETVTYGIHIHSNFIDTQAFYPKYKQLRVKPKEKKLFKPIRVDKAFSHNSYGTTSLYNFNPISENIYLMEKGGNYSEIKTEFIKDTKEDIKTIRFNNKKNTIREYLRDFYERNFTLYPYDTEKEVRQEVIREAYELYDEVKEFILRNSKKYEDIKVTETFRKNFLAEKEAERQRKKEIFHYLSVRTTGSFHRNRINGNILKNRFGENTVIYGFQDDRPALREVKRILKSELSYTARDHIFVIQISMKNERVVKEVLGDQACYIHRVERLSVMRKISNKYNKQAYINDLRDHGIKIRGMGYKLIPKYIDPEKPTDKEKREIYKTLGEQIKYPLLKYTMGAPDELKQEYKEMCKYHHINPILIGKKYIKENYEEDQCAEE